MYRHDLRRVRMHRLDNTFHCDVHGLLDEQETDDVLDRLRGIGMSDHDIALIDAYGPRWRIVLGEFLNRFARKRCIELRTVIDVTPRYLQ